MGYGGGGSGGGGSGGGGSGGVTGAIGGVSGASAAVGRTKKFLGSRAIMSGGSTPNRDTIDFWNIPVLSSALDFGDLSIGRQQMSSCSSGIRLVTFGGNASPDTSRIDYNTFLTLGDATDFGEMVGQRASGSNRMASAPDGNRGVFMGGTSPTTGLSNIDYITIGTTGNAIEFSKMTANRDGQAGCSDGVRGITAGGNPPADAAEYFNIGSLSDSVDWGEIAVAQIFAGNSGTSDGSRGVFVGGYGGGTDNRDNVQYVTIGTLGESVDYGELFNGAYGPTNSSDGSRMCTSGGSEPTGYATTIQYHQISQGGTALDFGELTQARGMAGHDSGG